MSYSEKLTVSFLKEMHTELGQITDTVEHILFLIDNLNKKYNEFVKENPGSSSPEAFKCLKDELKNLFKTCGFFRAECVEAQNKIADCSVELN